MENLRNLVKTLVQRYFVDGFYLIFPQIVAILIGLIALPIILANLPIANYGKWQLVLALQTWIIIFTAANITSASKRGISRGLNGTFLYGFLMRLKLLIPLGILVLGASFYFKILGQHIFSALLIIIGLYLIFGYLFQLSFTEFLIAKKKFKQWCFWQILNTSISMIGSAIIAYLTKNIIYFALFQLGSATVLGLIAWFLIIKNENLIESYKRGEIDKECRSFGFKLIPVDFINITAGTVSNFIIGPFFGFANLAVFSIANGLRDNFAGFMKLARPLLYSDFSGNKKDKLIKVLNSKLKYGIIGSIIITFFCIIAGYLYIKLFLPQVYQVAIIYFLILSLTLPPVMLQIIIYVILEVNFRYKELSALAIVPALIKIVLILLLGLLLGIVGICWGVVLGAWISFAFYYFLTMKRDFVVQFIQRHPWLEKISKKY